MLALTIERKKALKITLPDGRLIIIALRSDETRAKIVITAPRDCKINRIEKPSPEELYKMDDEYKANA